MGLSYNKLWKLLIDKKINKTQLHEKTGLSKSTITKLAKGENVNTEVLVRICQFLKCNVGDIIDTMFDGENYGNK